MMRDVMQQAGLEAFAEIGIIIFFVVFLLILARVLLMRKGEIEKASYLPLDEGEHEGTR